MAKLDYTRLQLQSGAAFGSETRTAERTGERTGVEADSAAPS